MGFVGSKLLPLLVRLEHMNTYGLGHSTRYVICGIIIAHFISETESTVDTELEDSWAVLLCSEDNPGVLACASNTSHPGIVERAQIHMKFNILETYSSEYSMFEHFGNVTCW